MNTVDLKGRTAMVTGAAKGLGKDIALTLAKQGATVAIHYHSSEKEASELLAELQKINPNCSMHQADLKNKSETEQMFAKIFAQHKYINILINNVGNFIYKPLTEATYEEIQDILDTNIMSTFLCTKLVIEQMKNQKWGRVINFGCAGADKITIREKTTPYYIAKTGVLMLTKNFALEYASFGITVNAISPGILETSIAEPLYIPAGRRAKSDDILNALLFLLQPTSGYVNGANLEVAGGWIP